MTVALKNVTSAITREGGREREILTKFLLTNEMKPLCCIISLLIKVEGINNLTHFWNLLFEDLRIFVVWRCLLGIGEADLVRRTLVCRFIVDVRI